MVEAKKALREHFGYTSFRPSQAGVIDRVNSGGHAMVVMPTGGGKSLCYQIPALMSDPASGELTLVLSPLVALMQDQVDSLLRRGIDATLINSSLDRASRLTRQQEIAAGKYRLLYVTPERFRKPEFVDVISRRRIRLLAIDEAHCVSQWGHDFRPDYSRVGEIRRWLGSPTTIALTATATRACRLDIYQQLAIAPDEIELFHEGIDRPNLSIDVVEVIDEDEKFEQIVTAIERSSSQATENTTPAPTMAPTPESSTRSKRPGCGTIVYFSLIKTLLRLSDRLRQRGIDHVTYHGDLSRRDRRRMQDAFMDGECDIVLATPAFGMGIDKEDIRLIVHAETPGSVESYYQEIGRAGRDGKPSRCLWLYDQNDLMTQMQFIAWSNPDAAFYDRLMHTLTTDAERVEAYGIDWLNRHLQRVSAHDHRLETALAMLDRHGVVEGPRPPHCFRVTGELPERFRDDALLNEKTRRDQQRLYAMVELAKTPVSERQAFLNRYFMD